jgi:uroporphyrinogen III methyltransferase/synthase
MAKGKVYLVGAGPGRADLITVRGAKLLQAADCIIYDKLANPALLRFARADAEVIHTPKRVGPDSVTQQEINRILVEKASAGRTVVRLKGGDPSIFARTSDELNALIEAGIDFEIVPGVTAAAAAGAYTGMLLTDRNYSSQVVFVTGHEAEGKEDSNIDWRLLAGFGGTIVLYMAVGALESITTRLMQHKMPGDTPVAVVTNATFPNQRTTKSTLGQVVKRCEEENVEPPAIIIIGQAAEADPRFDWLRKLPLFGQSIVLTRDAKGNADFAARVIERGANPIDFPTIELKPLTETNAFLTALTKITAYQWIAFTSANGVKFFFDALKILNKDGRVFAGSKIAAIGTETAAALRTFGIIADLVPETFTSQALGKALIVSASLKGKQVLLLRSRMASKELPDMLEEAGAQVDDVAVYEVVKVKTHPEALLADIKENKVDWLTFASPSAAESFFEQIHADVVNSSRAKVASIGPVTSEKLKALGLRVDVEASEHTLDGLVSAIEIVCRAVDSTESG